MTKLEQELVILRSAIEHTADHVMITNKDGVIKYVNPAFEQTTGYTKQDILGENPRILQSGKQPPEYYQALWKTILAGKTFHAHTINKKKNGSEYVADQTISPIMNKFGEITDFVSVWKDVTEKIRLQESLKIEKQKIEEIVGFDEKISRIRKSQALMDFVIAKTMKILEAKKCSIMLVDEEDEALCLQASKGFVEDIEPRKIKVRDSIAEKVVCSGKALLVQDAESDPLFFGAQKAYYAGRSFMVVPIRRDHDVIGVINVFAKDTKTKEEGIFNVTDLKILSLIAKEVSVALENMKFYKELQYLTLTDPLTGVHNFRHFAKSLDYEIVRLKYIPGHLAVMMIDIDHLQSYNDQFGNQAGDGLLKEVSQMIQGELREVDIFCRYAGDQFGVILPGGEKKASEIVAERIRKIITETSFKKPVTVSIGVAHFMKETTRRDLTAKANQALYQAKKDSTNKVCFF